MFACTLWKYIFSTATQPKRETGFCWANAGNWFEKFDDYCFSLLSQRSFRRVAINFKPASSTDSDGRRKKLKNPTLRVQYSIRPVKVNYVLRCFLIARFRFSGRKLIVFYFWGIFFEARPTKQSVQSFSRVCVSVCCGEPYSSGLCQWHRITGA